MDIQNQIEKLQKKSYETKIRIVWATVIICAVALLAIWFLGLRSNLKNIDPKSLINSDTSTSAKVSSAETSENYVTVENIEKAGGLVKLYFNINNTSSDILNVPSIENISYVENENTLHPTSINDRQGQAFVQKVLSHTKNFGILTFTTADLQNGKLIFDQMFFENSVNQTFRQELDVDIGKLKNIKPPRN